MTGAGLSRARALPRLAFLLLAAAGLCLVAQGAWIPAKAALAQLLLERAFAAGAAAGTPVRPWPWADAAPVARIHMPRLGLRQIVLSGGSSEAMAFGPTLMPGAATLDGRGTAVIAAHRDTHFSALRHVRLGDEIVVEQPGGRTSRYRVRAARVVRGDAYALERHEARRSLALVTCWPFDAAGLGPLRYVVEASEAAPARS